MKKLILFLTFIFLASVGNSQQVTTISQNVLSLKGKGKIGQNKDSYQYYQFNTYISGNRFLQAYFRSISNKASSFSGLAFRNVSNFRQTDGGIQVIAVVIENDTLKIYQKNSYNQKTEVVYSNHLIKTPCYLRVEKSGNDFIAYYSSQAENATNINFIQAFKIINAFDGWNNITQNFITGSQVQNQNVVAVASKRTFGVFNPVIENQNADSQGIIYFTNTIKTIPYETENDKFNASLWPTIGVKDRPFDSKRVFPKIAILWQHKLDNFHNNGKKWYDLGIPFATDKNPQFGGAGRIQCVDWIRYQDPNTGCPWGQTRDANNNCVGNANNIDPFCTPAQTYFTFKSKTPFERRAFGDGGTAIPFGNASNEQKFDIGRDFVSSAEYGYGDNETVIENGTSYTRTNNGVAIADIENANHGSIDEMPVMLGMAKSSTGIVLNHYGQSINIAIPRLSHYPSSNFTYPTNELDIDGSVSGPINNVILGLWNPNSRVSISGRGINNQGIIDNKRIGECSELSFYSGSAKRQGERLYYDKDNPNLYRLINKFGKNRNAEHNIGFTIYGVEVRKMHMRQFFPEHLMFTMPKFFADRGFIGNTNFGGKFGNYIDNEALKALHFDRLTTLGMTMFTFFQGSHLVYWDRNSSDQNLDGSHGVLQGVNWVNQTKNFTSGQFSFADVFATADYKLYESEISYDGGSTWSKDKGVDYINSMNLIPQRQVLANGVWYFFLHRNEKVEPKACKLRIKYNGIWHYVTITPDMWDTVNPNQRNTPLANLPDVDKDFILGCIDLNATNTNPNPNPTPTPTPVVVNPPTLTVTQQPTHVGVNTTISQQGCSSFVDWYKNSSFLQTSNTLTVVANNTDKYKTKCRDANNNVSIFSNEIGFSGLPNAPPANSSVTITEPAFPPLTFSDGKPASYYDDKSKLPAIFTNGADYDPAKTVWLENDKAKYGLDLTRGGQIAYASPKDAFGNLIGDCVFRGYDGGFQWVIDATTWITGGRIHNQTSSSPQNNENYNTTMGGTHQNRSQTLIDYRRLSSNSYLVKFRAMLYPFNDLISEVEITVIYTLDGYTLKAEYTYHSFRTDGLFPVNPTAPSGVNGWAIPIAFCHERLRKYQSYVGNAPWTNGQVQDGDVPNTTPQQGQNGTTNGMVGLQAKESWGLVYDPSNGLSAGIMNLSEAGNDGVFMNFEIREKYFGHPAGGNSGNGARTVMDIKVGVLVPNPANYTKVSTAYFCVAPNPETVRQEFYKVKNQ